MATCEVCGNDYDEAMEISVADGTSHTFDSFECGRYFGGTACERWQRGQFR